MILDNKNSIIAKNKIVMKAFKTVVYSKKTTFITGNFSTGKSTLKESIINLTDKKYIELSPNEFEAIKKEEESFQSFFKTDKLKFDSKLNLLNELTYSNDKINFIKELEIIVIDEISQFTSENLDLMNIILQKVRGNSNPMGGIQLLIVGDIFDSSPKISKKEIDKIKEVWNSQYFFDAKCYESLEIENFYLYYSFFKIGDFYYSDFINLLKQNRLKNDFLYDFNTIHCEQNNSYKRENSLIITVDSKKANEINESQLFKLNDRKFNLYAEIEGDFNSYLAPVDAIITINENSKVILLKNKNDNFSEYHNGTLGILKSEHMGIIEVETEKYGLLRIQKKEWKNFRHEYDEKSKKIKKKVVGVFSQYPILLGWAISINDSLEMMFDNDIHFDNNDEINFKSDYVYRLYNRCNGSVNNFSISNPLKESDISTDISKQNYYRDKIFRPIEIEVEN